MSWVLQLICLVVGMLLCFFGGMFHCETGIGIGLICIVLGLTAFRRHHRGRSSG